jgi:hypothetical protein
MHALERNSLSKILKITKREILFPKAVFGGIWNTFPKHNTTHTHIIFKE